MKTQSDLTETLRCLLIKCIRQLSIYKHRRKSRLALLKLDDARLKDIGISRSDAEKESAKPFWVGDSFVIDTKEHARVTRYLAPRKAAVKF